MTKLFFLVSILIFCGISTVNSLQCYSCLDCNTVDANSPVASCGALSSPESAETKVKTIDDAVELEQQDDVIGEHFNEKDDVVRVARDRREIKEIDSKAAQYVCFTITYKVFNSEHKARGCYLDFPNLCEIVEQQADVKCSICRDDKCNNS